MDDLTANHIVFGILLLIIFGIISTLYTIFGQSFGQIISRTIKNNSGNLSTFNILLSVSGLILVVGIIYWLLQRNSMKRFRNLTRD